jgi:hypothetical protein
MKVYDIVTPYNYSQTHSVVAESMGEAERLYKQKYNTVRIVEIKLHAEYVVLAAREETDHDD